MFRTAYWNYYTAFKICRPEKLISLIPRLTKNQAVISCVYCEKEHLLYREPMEQLTVLVDNPDMSLELKDYICQIRTDRLDQNRRLPNLISKKNQDKVMQLALLPVIMQMTEQHAQLCPVHVDIMGNGHAVLRISVCLQNQDADPFYHYPMKRCYEHLEVPHFLVEKEKDSVYRQISHSDDGVGDLIFVVQQYIEEMFGSDLIDEQEYAACENFVIAQMDDPDIHKIRGSQHDAIRRIFHLLNPEEFATILSNSEAAEFWSAANRDISGMKLLVGNNFRFLMYTDMDAMLERYGRNTTELDTGAYLQRSMELSFEILIELAIMRKLNERYIYLASARDMHKVNRHLTEYYLNQNYFDDLVDTTPIMGRKFYEAVISCMEYKRSLFQAKERLERLAFVEQQNKGRLQERLSLVIESISVIGTLIFGLPAVTDTLHIVKSVAARDRDLLIWTVDQVAIAVWLLLIFVLLLILWRSWSSYRRYKG